MSRPCAVSSFLALITGGMKAPSEGKPNTTMVIKAKKLDTAHGLDIEFVERPPDAYTTQFNSGEFKVGGSAAVLTVGLADARGVKVKYLFNLFDYWGTVVTSRPEIKTLKDLEGKQLAAASSTTNFVMSSFFAKQQ